MKYFLLLLSLLSNFAAANDAIWVQAVDKPLTAIYKPIYQELEKANFYVVFEPNIGKSISGFAERWGDKYNQNKLTAIRSMVFCNGWYANKVSNADPEALALCPLHITLIEKDGKSRVLFTRPSYIAQDSDAKPIAIEIENKVINAITTALKN